ncbi:MAG: HupE/UreJ family protein [Ferrovibrio sp.]|uniref:HupE/UreJ family protein n=1 Tax=Ferrovibrio sp. TaxID=1917215 RepID=UPI0026271B92|nr:HupE/UreJ family protein [Ferrovibrio sp.]MCW0233944.1 HupE/UreJ family protein [Ferrovibrio sp.]
MSFKSKLGQAVLPAVVLASLALPALAHPGHPGGEPVAAGFTAGFTHPFGGFDHLMAMLAVGLWAIQQSGQTPRALWLLPASFVVAMAGGFVLGLAQVALPGVEAGIALSVLLLGLIVAFAVRPPLPAAMAVTALFAVFHGHAHGTELGDASQAVTYALGMVLATALLHGLGLAAARLAQHVALPALTRAAGAAVALAGIVILVG